MLKKLCFLIFLILPQVAQAIESSWEGIDEAELRLISPLSSIREIDFKQISPSPDLFLGKEIILGLQYKLKNGWKTYWKSPGEGGLAQTIDYSESKNIESLEILWPSPKSFSILGTQSLGYENVLFSIYNIIL